MKSKQHADERQLKLKTAFETYCDMVFRLALSRTRNQTYADDILGEVFLKLTENIGKLKSNEHIKAWLIRVTINCSNNYLKKICRENAFPNEDIPVFDDPEFGEVYYAVLALPENYRTAIHLYYYEDLTIKDISIILNQSESATKMQLKRAKEKLKSILGDNYNVC